MRNLCYVLMLTAILVSGCVGWIREGNDMTGPTINQQGFSLLTKAGIAEIERTKHGRFDIRTGTLTKNAVGLDDSNPGPMIGHPGGEDLTFTFLAPAREETIVTQNITFATADPTSTIETIVWFSAPPNIEAAHAELRSGIYRWGFRPEDVELWITDSAKHDADKATLGMGVGLAGLVVEVTARKKNGNDIYQYSMHLDPALYEADVLDSIRRTGTEPR